VDRRCQAGGDAGTAHCAGSGVDRQRQAEELEVPGVLKGGYLLGYLAIGARQHSEQIRASFFRHSRRGVWPVIVEHIVEEQQCC